MIKKLFIHRSLPEMYNIDVGDDNKIYTEASGKKDGIPVIFVHGGPGGQCRSEHHSLFNPLLVWIHQNLVLLIWLVMLIYDRFS